MQSRRQGQQDGRNRGDGKSTLSTLPAALSLVCPAVTRRARAPASAKRHGPWTRVATTGAGAQRRLAAGRNGERCRATARRDSRRARLGGAPRGERGAPVLRARLNPQHRPAEDVRSRARGQRRECERRPSYYQYSFDSITGERYSVSALRTVGLRSLRIAFASICRTCVVEYSSSSPISASVLRRRPSRP